MGRWETLLLNLCRGRTGRQRYALWGLGLFFVKWNLDRLIAAGFFNRLWLPWSYVVPSGTFSDSSPWRDDPGLALVLLLLSLPFIAAGVLLTVRRLRDIGWSVWAALLFFAPFVNLAFFLVLSLQPSSTSGPPPLPASPAGRLRRIFGFQNPLASAAVAVLLTVVLVVALVSFGSLVVRSYGWGLFVGIPFVGGFLGAVIHGLATPRTWAECATVGLLLVCLAGGVLVLAAVEGVICILMAAPLAIPLVLLGSSVGYVVQREHWNRRLQRGAALYCGAWVLLPVLLLVEAKQSRAPVLIGATTAVEIAAPPATVWRHVVEFSELPAPHELVFRSGIAYPVRARIIGRGVGAVRHCEFSTGPFVEPITVWDEPAHLAFDVIEQPHPMRELSPYRALHPPHLDGFFLSRRGEFRLTALPGGRTRLDGTTWYEQRLWPARYWQAWSDWLVHTIHTRVLNHIKAEAESAPQP